MVTPSAGSVVLVPFPFSDLLFTGNQGLMVRQVGKLTNGALEMIVDAVVELLRRGLKP